MHNIGNIQTDDQKMKQDYLNVEVSLERFVTAHDERARVSLLLRRGTGRLGLQWQRLARRLGLHLRTAGGTSTRIAALRGGALIHPREPVEALQHGDVLTLIPVPDCWGGEWSGSSDDEQIVNRPAPLPESVPNQTVLSSNASRNAPSPEWRDVVDSGAGGDRVSDISKEANGAVANEAVANAVGANDSVANDAVANDAVANDVVADDAGAYDAGTNDDGSNDVGDNDERRGDSEAGAVDESPEEDEAALLAVKRRALALLSELGPPTRRRRMRRRRRPRRATHDSHSAVADSSQLETTSHSYSNSYAMEDYGANSDNASEEAAGNEAGYERQSMTEGGMAARHWQRHGEQRAPRRVTAL